MIWADNMLIPNLATHKDNAEKWINYYYEPEVAAKLADYNSYICPVKGAQEAMEKVDPDQVDNELIFPTEKSLAADSRIHGARRGQDADLRKGFCRCHRCMRGRPPSLRVRIQGPAARRADQGVRDLHRGEVARPGRSARLVLRPPGPVRLRQDHDAAHGRRPRDPDVGHDPARRHRDHVREALQRPVNTVFQNYALFPHLNIFKNVAFGLRTSGG